jgi:hypothetical protein
LYTYSCNYHSKIQIHGAISFHFTNRGHITLFTGDNVLSKETLLLLLNLHHNVRAMKFQNKTYEDVCLRTPLTDILLSNKRRRRRRKRQTGEDDATIATANETENVYESDYDYFNFYIGDVVEEEEKEEDHVKDDDDDDLPPEVYCDIVETLNDKCGEYSLLEIWNYDEERIKKLSQQGRDSPMFKNYSSLRF